MGSLNSLPLCTNVDYDGKVYEIQNFYQDHNLYAKDVNGISVMTHPTGNYAGKKWRFDKVDNPNDDKELRNCYYIRNADHGGKLYPNHNNGVVKLSTPDRLDIAWCLQNTAVNLDYSYKSSNNYACSISSYRFGTFLSADTGRDGDLHMEAHAEMVSDSVRVERDGSPEGALDAWIMNEIVGDRKYLRN